MKKVLLLSFLIVTFLIANVFSNAYSQMPRYLNYQASLLDENNRPLHQNVPMTFAIYDSETGGRLLWNEIQNVQAVFGFINVYLGKENPINLPFDKPYWLEISVGGGNPYPRTKLTAVPYSYYTLFASQSDTAVVALDIIDGAITQSKLAPGVQAIPWGPAGGDLQGEYQIGRASCRERV